MLGIEETKAHPGWRLEDFFRQYLVMAPTSLSRIKGDWKKTLTAQVIKFARRKGLVEELELKDTAFWRTVRLAIIHCKESSNGTAIQSPRD